jgi:hypothetical protein
MSPKIDSSISYHLIIVNFKSKLVAMNRSIIRIWYNFILIFLSCLLIENHLKLLFYSNKT